MSQGLEATRMLNAVSLTRTASGTEAADGAQLVPFSTHLFVVLEPERPRAGGARYSLAATSEVLIGRGPERSARRQTGNGVTQLALSLPASRVSSVHARLRNHRGHWTIQDLGSTNGTFLNGTRIAEAVLKDRDLLEMGQVALIFREALLTPVDALTEAELDASANECEVRTLLPFEVDRLRVL